MSKEPSKVDQRAALRARQHAERMRRGKPLTSDLPSETKAKLDDIIKTAIARTEAETAVPPEVAEIVRKFQAEAEAETPHEECIAEIVEKHRPKAAKPAAKAAARDKKKSLTVWLDPVLVKKLKAAAVDREKTIEEIVAKAIAVELARGAK